MIPTKGIVCNKVIGTTSALDLRTWRAGENPGCYPGRLRSRPTKSTAKRYVEVAILADDTLITHFPARIGLQHTQLAPIEQIRDPSLGHLRPRL